MIALWVGLAFGQAWTPSAGEAYVQGGLSTYSSGASFDGAGKRSSGERFRNGSFGVYADVGLGHRLAARTSLALAVAGTEQRSAAVGLNDAFFGLRYAVAKSVAVEWTHNIPLSDGRVRPLHTSRVWATGLSVHAGGGLTILGRNAWVQQELGGRVPLAFGPDPAAGNIAWRIDAASQFGMWFANPVGAQLRLAGFSGIPATLNEQRRDLGFTSFASTPPSSTLVDASVGVLLRPSDASPWLGQITLQQTLYGRDIGSGTLVSVNLGHSAKPSSR